MDRPVQAGGLDAQGDGAVAQHAAEAGIVLVKNTDGVLPLASGGARRVAVIGGHADLGVLSGGGSPQAVPIGSISFPAPDVAPSRGGGHVFHPSPLLAARPTRTHAGSRSHRRSDPSY